jgi:hypothetical protein
MGADVRTAAMSGKTAAWLAAGDADTPDSLATARSREAEVERVTT